VNTKISHKQKDQTVPGRSGRSAIHPYKRIKNCDNQPMVKGMTEFRLGYSLLIQRMRQLMKAKNKT